MTTPRLPRLRFIPAALVLAIVTLAIVRAVPAAAQTAPPDAPPVEVQITVQPSTVRLGEHVRLTILVHHDERLLVAAERPLQTAELLIVDVAPETRTPPAAGGTRVTTEFGFTLAAFRLGAISPGALRVSWLRDDGVTGELVVTTPTFEVTRTITDPAADLRPLKPQLSLGEAPPLWQRPEALAGGLAVVAAAGAAAVLWRRARRRRAAAGAPSTVDETIEREARARLTAIAERQLPEQAQYEQFYGGVSATVREYLSRRFEFPATAMTTSELAAQMTAHGVERWQARLVSGLLDRCDAAVYAGRHPDPASADHDLTMAFEIVELSRPADPSEPATSPEVVTAGASERP